MVRFIIPVNALIEVMKKNLHSNMVRFIIHCAICYGSGYVKFTFQYG